MSSVRMCDKCGVIFSENDEGWSSTNGGIQRRRENGSRYTEQVNIDLCAACTNGGMAPGPRLPAAIAGSVASYETTANLEDENRDLRIGQLERELGELRGREGGGE